MISKRQIKRLKEEAERAGREVIEIENYCFTN